MQPERIQSQRESTLKISIFIGCIPSKIPEPEIKSYFTSFGSVDEIRFFYVNTKRKGYAILYTSDPLTSELILRYPKHVLGGHQLVVRPDLREDKLKNFLEEQQNKKILMKKVPPELCDNNVKLALELQFGKVEFIYNIQENHESKYRCCFANFISEEIANTAKRVGILHFEQGLKILITEPMKPKLRGRIDEDQDERAPIGNENEQANHNTNNGQSYIDPELYDKIFDGREGEMRNKSNLVENKNQKSYSYQQNILFERLKKMAIFSKFTKGRTLKLLKFTNKVELNHSALNILIRSAKEVEEEQSSFAYHEQE